MTDIITVTPEGNRLNDPAVVEIAQASGLLTETGVFSAQAEIAPTTASVAFAHRLFDAVSFTEEQQKEARAQEHAIKDELDLVQKVQHLLDRAKEAGFKFTVSLNHAGAPIPMAMKA